MQRAPAKTRSAATHATPRRRRLIRK
jgi:hypothetical protein